MLSLHRFDLLTGYACSDRPGNIWISTWRLALLCQVQYVKSRAQTRSLKFPAQIEFI
jgi:hypothetical protein